LSLLACTVSHAAIYFVSESGDDDNPGTESLPWQTIQKAADNMVAGDVCYIRAGTYRETVRPANSGTAGSPITFEAYPGESVVINGCDAVTGSWTVDSGSVHKVDVTMALGHENQVFVNGTDMVWEARWPDVGTTSLDGLLEFATQTMGAGTTSTSLNNNAIPDYDWTGGSVWISSKRRWFCWTGQITGFGEGTVSFVNNADAGGNMEAQSGGHFYLFGVRDALDGPNEWFYDELADKLYLWMPDGGAPSGVEVKKRIYGFRLSSRQNIHIRDIQLFATSIETNDNSDSLVLDGLRMEHAYHSNKGENAYDSQRVTGLVLRGTNHELKNSEIAYCSGSGVFLNGSGHWIVNNHVHDTDYIGSYASTIEMIGADMVISHNTLMRSGRSVIGLRDSFRSLIQHNDIAFAGYLTADLGLVYGNGIEGENLVVRYNAFHDNVSSFKNFGIYYDHGCRNIITHHNVVWNVNDSGIHNNQYADYLLWYNNTSENGGATSILSKWAAAQAQELHGCQYFNNVLSGGIDIIATGYVAQDNFTNYVDLDANQGLLQDSAAIDTGRRIGGIAEGFIGLGTDAGAFEYGAPRWEYGHDFNNFPVVDSTKSLPEARNLLVNSSFEEGVLAPWVKMATPTALNFAQNGSQWTVDGTTLMGAYSVALGPDKSGISQTVTGLQPDTEYELMGRFRVDAGESAHLGVTNHGGDEIFGTVVTDTSNLWVKETLTFRTGPDSTSATVYGWKNSPGSGTVYFEGAGLQVVEPYLVKEDFESGLSGWTNLEGVSLDTTVQSPFDNNGTEVQAVRLFDDETTNTRMDRTIAADPDDTLFIQFDYRYSEGVSAAGFQLWGNSVKGINLHMTGWGENDDAIQNRGPIELVTLTSGLLPDVWYRFTLTIHPVSTTSDSYDLVVRSLESGSPFYAAFTGLPFFGNLTSFDFIRFHFNTNPENSGGEYYIDNVVLSSSQEELFTDQDNDGIEDSWELAYFTDLTFADANSDSDLDGNLDSQEYFFDTDPLGGFSSVALSPSGLEDGMLRLSLETSPHRDYQLYQSSDMVIWDHFYTIYGTGEEILLELDPPGSAPENQSAIFYQVTPVIFKN
jgi:hypothetical protein